MSKKEILQDYLSKQVRPIFDRLLSKLLIERPIDIYSWTIAYLQQEQKIMNHKPVESEEEEDDEIDEDEQTKKQQKKANRQAVSAEAYGNYNKKEDFKARIIQKSQEQIARIKNKVLNSFMFQALDEKDLKIVIDAMEEKRFKPQDWVIRQGEDGNELYVIDSGNLDCYKQFKPNEEAKKVRSYVAGESFGELALLYNAPRAASIQAVTESVAFALDRDTFNNIVKFSAIKQREQLEEIISKIELLQSMEAYEKLQLIDAMKKIKFSKGDYVIKEGEKGEEIFLIIEGTLEAWKQKSDGTQTKVYEYSLGDYFGELALLKNAPRQASVKATSDVTLLSCDFNSFRRLMGPLEGILRRNEAKYAQYLK